MKKPASRRQNSFAEDVEMNSRCLVLVILAVASFLGAATKIAAEENSWAGENVLPKKPVKDISFDNQVDGKEISFTLSNFLPFRVREERDGTLRIHDAHREGWANKA